MQSAIATKFSLSLKLDCMNFIMTNLLRQCAKVSADDSDTDIDIRVFEFRVMLHIILVSPFYPSKFQ